MITSSLELIPGKRIVAHLGIVQGSTVRAKHVGKDIFAGLKNIVGGELKGYTELMQEARQEATDRMIAEARSVGANAVLNVRFATTSIAVGAAEILAYGSAVKLENI
ncbi:MAG: YbjQ family protein [Burkholderiales bacterium]|nr:YbjQ family protein [Burkholderiales bacterium]